MKLGRIPVAMNSPWARPFASTPIWPEREDLLHDDRVAFHADHFGDARHLARAALQPAGLDDQVDGRRKLRPQGADRQLEAGHADHGLQPRQGVARGIGVNGGHRAFMAGVHGLDHVERLGAAALADDDPVGPHSQRVLDQVGRRHGPAALDIAGTRLQAHDVVLLQLQLGRVFDRDDAMIGMDEARERVQERRLARAGPARDDDVQPRLHGPFHEREHLGGERLVAEQVVLGERAANRTSGS